MPSPGLSHPVQHPVARAAGIGGRGGLHRRRGSQMLGRGQSEAVIRANRYARRMMLKRRRIKWADGTDAANDFSVIDERGKKIGRIYRTVAVGGGYAWNWTVYYRGPAGCAPTLEAAQTAFKAAWAMCAPR